MHEDSNIYAGRFSEISHENWKEGVIDWNVGKLSSGDWEFNNIQIPSCCLKALVLQRENDALASKANGGVIAPTLPTPYLRLLDLAVKQFWQGGKPPGDKKETITQWISEQQEAKEIELSNHIAGVMATIIRPVESGIGGNKKTPNYRD